MEASETLDVFKSNSPAQTKKIAQDLAKSLTGGDVVALYGDLGAGKTVFVKGLAAGLGITSPITSPTFVFVKSYPLKINNRAKTFYHLDLYRASSSTDIKSLGLDEIFTKSAIVVVEWADRLTKLPKPAIRVVIKKLNEKERLIKIDRKF